MQNFLSGAIIFGIILFLWEGACIPGGSPATPEPPPKVSTVATQAPSPQKAAWETEWNKLVTEAKKEGKITIYGQYSASLREKVNKAFADRYGIDIEWLAGAGPETSRRILAERKANLFLTDLIFAGPATLFLTLKPQGILTPLEPLIIFPEALDPKAWPEGRVPYLDRDRQILHLTAAYRTFVLANTELVKENEVNSYQDLLKPQWKGKMVMFDPTITGATNSFIALVLKSLGLEQGEKYLRQVAAQEPAILKDKRLHVEWVAKGKYPIALGADPGIGSEFFKVGAPIRWVQMVEGAMVHPMNSALSLPDIRPHPNASVLLLNWLLTQEGQTAFSQGFGSPAMRLGITTQGLDPFMIPPRDKKLYYFDESSPPLEEKAMEIGKEVFGALMK